MTALISLTLVTDLSSNIFRKIARTFKVPKEKKHGVVMQEQVYQLLHAKRLWKNIVPIINGASEAM